MFSVEGDSSARMSRSAINHSVGAGPEGGGAMGAVTVWQGDVSRTSRLWRGPSPQPPHHATTSLPLSSSLSSHVSSLYLGAVFTPWPVSAGPGCHSRRCVSGCTYHGEIGYIEF